MRQFTSSSLVGDLRRGQYYNRNFQTKAYKQISTPIEKPFVYGHVKRILELQGFVTDPETDNRSRYDPDKLFVALDKYHPKLQARVSQPEFSQAVRLARQTFGRNLQDVLLPMTLQEVSQVVHVEKSSGAPYYEKKGEVLEKDLPRAMRIMTRKKAPDPCTSFVRLSKPGDSGPSHRLVWGYPLSMSLIEGRLAYPLVRKFLGLKTPMAFGLTNMGTITRMAPIVNCDYVYGLDYSKFDSSASVFLIREAFDILKTWYPPEYNWLWDRIIHYFIYTPIVMPDGFVYKKERGVPSGSWFTQLVDTIINYIAIQYVMIRLTGKPLTNRRILVLGDDSLIGLNHPINLSQYQDVLAELGLVLNIEKSSVSRLNYGAHFLGSEWIAGTPHRSPVDLAKRMIYPERVDFKKRITATERTGEYLNVAEEAFPIFLDTLAEEHGCVVGATPVPAAASYVNVGATQGYEKFRREEFGSSESCGTLAHMYTSIMK